jgi:hypothetical protein
MCRPILGEARVLPVYTFRPHAVAPECCRGCHMEEVVPGHLPVPALQHGQLQPTPRDSSRTQLGALRKPPQHPRIRRRRYDGDRRIAWRPRGRQPVTLGISHQGVFNGASLI